jgi:hypothetical protein
MLIVDSQIHLWQNGKMSAQHRQIPTYSADDALAEMASAGVDCAVIHPPSALGEAVNVLAVEAVRQHPDKFCILGHFDLQSPDCEKIVARWRERPGMRVKLLKLIWDLVGTEFGGRQLQYDMFYSAAQHVADMRLYRWYDWSRGRAMVDRCLEGY